MWNAAAIVGAPVLGFPESAIMAGQKHSICSFCGKPEEDVTRLLAGAKAFICNECVSAAKKLTNEQAEDSQSRRDPRGILRRV